jgi:hypothetical protein
MLKLSFVVSSILGFSCGVDAAPPLKWVSFKNLDAIVRIEKGVHPHKCTEFGVGRSFIRSASGAEEMRSLRITPTEPSCTVKTTASFAPSGVATWSTKLGEQRKFVNRDDPKETLTVTVTGAGITLDLVGGAETYSLREKPRLATYKVAAGFFMKVEAEQPDEVAPYVGSEKLVHADFICAPNRVECELKFANGRSMVLAESDEIYTSVVKDFRWDKVHPFERRAVLVRSYGAYPAQLVLFE